MHRDKFADEELIFAKEFLIKAHYEAKHRSTEECSKLKSPETRKVQERLVSILEHLQVPKWDTTRFNSYSSSTLG